MKIPHAIMLSMVLLMPLPAMAQDPPASGVAGRAPLNRDVAAVYRVATPVHGDTAAADAERRLDRQALIGQYRQQAAMLTGMASAASNRASSATQRFDPTVNHVTPTVRGWSAGVIYSVGEAAFSNRFNRAYGAVIGFEQAPLTLRLAHQRRINLSDASTVVPMVDKASRHTRIAASLALRHATVSAGVGVNRGIGSAPDDPEAPYGTLVLPALGGRSRDLLAGLAIACGDATCMLSYLHQDDRTLANRDATQLALGVVYALSKRTGLYTAFGKIDNRTGARDTVGHASDRGHGKRVLSIGLRHAF